MNAQLWRELLTSWNADLLRTPDIVARLPEEVVACGWLGYPGATEEQVRRAEARLGASLPASYREFLKVTNGWRHLDFFYERLWSTEEVDWFRVRNQGWIDAWLGTGPKTGSEPSIPNDKYYIYDERQDSPWVRVEYMPSLLEVSDVGDSVILLLNPRVVFPDGEWEAWDLGNWYPGAQRYRSFWGMMQARYRGFLDLRDDQSAR